MPQTKFILLDTETTGTSAADKICELAIMVKEVGQKTLLMRDFCKPDCPISFEAMSVNHITNEMVQNAPICAQTATFKKLLELNTENNIIIGHNIGFDLDMLKKDGFECKMQIIDSLRCIKHLDKSLKSYKLQYLRYALGLYKQETSKNLAHSSLGDVIVLDLLMTHMYAMNDVDTQKLLSLTSDPVLLTTINFGKYKNQEFKAIEKGYLEWLSKNSTDPDVVYTAKVCLGG